MLLRVGSYLGYVIRYDNYRQVYRVELEFSSFEAQTVRETHEYILNFGRRGISLW